MAEYIEREKTVELLRSLGSRDYRRENGTIQDAIKMLSSPEYTPSADVAPVVHGRWIHTDSHLWYKTDDGRIDEWRFDVDYHNGPECQVCGYTPCMHCHPDYMKDKCPQGHYICSECANESVDGHEKFCSNCGAKMDLKKESEEK